MEANELLSVARQIKKLINKKMEPVLADCELKPIEVDILSPICGYFKGNNEDISFIQSSYFSFFG